MKERRWILRDNYGWPVVGIINRPVVTFIRYLIHTNIRETYRRRNDGWPKSEPNDSCQCYVGEKNAG